MRTADQIREELASRQAVVDRREVEWNSAKRETIALIERCSGLMDQGDQADDELVMLAEQFAFQMAKRKNASRAIAAQSLEMRRLEEELAAVN